MGEHLGVPPSFWGLPSGHPLVGGYPQGHPPPVGGTPRVPPSWGVPPGAPPSWGVHPGAPPYWGVPWDARQLGGGTPSGTPQLGVPLGVPPVWGRYSRGWPPGPPCEQTNWKHYLSVILRMRAVKMVVRLWLLPGPFFRRSWTLFHGHV